MAQRIQQGYVLDPALLRDFCRTLLEHEGMSVIDAQIAAEVLVRTDLRGVHSHGVRHLPNYIKRIQAGGIDPTAKFEVIQETATTALINANAGLGHVLSYKAVQLGIDKARQHDIAIVLVRNSNHFGAAGHYALMCAEAGYIGIVLTNAPLIMTVTGSRGRVLGNGPTAYGVPSATAPIVLDIAMSVVAGSIVSMAAQRGESVPEGWIVDPAGFPSTNPKDMLDGGALVPIGGHKGYGIALLGELLAGALSGAAMAAAVGGPRPDGLRVSKGAPWNVGHAFIVLKVTPFMPLDLFKARVLALSQEIRNSPRAPGAERIYLPGEIEDEKERRQIADGIDFDEVTWRTLEKLATSVEMVDLLRKALRV